MVIFICFRCVFSDRVNVKSFVRLLKSITFLITIPNLITLYYSVHLFGNRTNMKKQHHSLDSYTRVRYVLDRICHDDGRFPPRTRSATGQGSGRSSARCLSA